MQHEITLGSHYIDGQFTKSFKSGPGTFASLNPCNEETVGIFPLGTAEDINFAVASAKAAFPAWKAVSRVQRAEFFDHLAQLIKRDFKKLQNMISLETGKNLNESLAETNELLHMVQVACATGRASFGEVYASELSEKEIIVQRKPRGVVAVITPWNFPAAIMQWCCAPAIVEGCTVVIKPSELTPCVAHLMAELFAEAGFPKGVFNIIHGDGTTGKYLVESNVDVVLFTGSSEVGQGIRKHCAETWHKTCSIETGSKSAVIVCADGDIDLGVEASISSALKLSGQRCVSASRILVELSIFNEFKKKFVERIAKLQCGNPFSDPAPYFGPLISKESLERVKQYNQMIREDKDAEVLLDPDIRSDYSKDGYFISPFVYAAEWDNTKPYLVEEIFGPCIGIIPFDGLKDAIKIHNDTPYGLSCAIITEDFRNMRQAKDELNIGMLYVNSSCIGAESHVPFGGPPSKSGNGCKSAAGTFKAVTSEIVVTTNYEKGQFKFAQGMK